MSHRPHSGNLISFLGVRVEFLHVRQSAFPTQFAQAAALAKCAVSPLGATLMCDGGHRTKRGTTRPHPREFTEQVRLAL